jgi:hypothetical protein
MDNKVIIALDFPGANEVSDFLGLFREEKLFVRSAWSFFMPRVRRS